MNENSRNSIGSDFILLVTLSLFVPLINSYSQGDVVYKKDSTTAAINISKAPILFEGKVISSNSFKDSAGNI